jgi:hypothetical protein
MQKCNKAQDMGSLSATRVMLGLKELAHDQGMTLLGETM